jgi:hypothetical protein
LIDEIPIIGQLFGNVSILPLLKIIKLQPKMLMQCRKQDKSNADKGKERRDLSDGLNGIPFLGGLFGKVGVHMSNPSL